MFPKGAPALPGYFANIPNMWTGIYGQGPGIGAYQKIWQQYFTDAANAYISLANSLPNGAVQKLPGNQVPAHSGDDWLAELINQHFPKMYYTLLGQIKPAIMSFPAGIPGS